MAVSDGPGSLPHTQRPQAAIAAAGGLCRPHAAATTPAAAALSRAIAATMRSSRFCGTALLILFCLLYSSSAAVEEPTPGTTPGPAVKWCHAKAFIRYDTWHLLMALTSAIAMGDATMLNAERAKIEDDTRFRLKKALTFAKRAHHQLIDFLEIGAVPTSDPWPAARDWDKDFLEYPYQRHPLPNSTFIEEDGATGRAKRAIPLLVLVGISVGAAALGVTAITMASFVFIQMSELRMQAMANHFAIEQLSRRTSAMADQIGTTADEVASNFNRTMDNVALLIARTEDLALEVDTRSSLTNAHEVLESLTAAAMDLPALVGQIRRTGQVHPAYVPPEVWVKARELLTTTDIDDTLWTPEATGANATWHRNNQTLVIHVPASCDTSAAAFDVRHTLQYHNTSVVLQFSNWTEAKVLQTVQLQKLKETSLDTVEQLACNREKNTALFNTQHDLDRQCHYAVARVTSSITLLVVLMVISSALYIVSRNRTIAQAAVTRLMEAGHLPQAGGDHCAAAEQALRQMPSLPPARPEGLYESAPHYYPGTVAVPKTHAMNTADLRKLQVEQLLAQQKDCANMSPLA